MTQIEIALRNDEFSQMKVLSNHIYEIKKGVRKMVLYTIPIKFAESTYRKLRSQQLDYFVQPVGNSKVNIFFGRRECVETTRQMITCPLHQLSPEEDFILGMMLGYDVCAQCERYCKMKERHTAKSQIAVG